ncbi:hypothetical protein GC176_08145 [bacterium]|nr:hypothetical protein [bacterium]
MAGLNKYDKRLEGLVVETRTLWDPAVKGLSDDDRAWLSQAIHESPELASRISYERAHTGFTREITVTIEDIQRLYQERVAAG